MEPLLLSTFATFSTGMFGYFAARYYVNLHTIRKHFEQLKQASGIKKHADTQRFSCSGIYARCLNELITLSMSYTSSKTLKKIKNSIAFNTMENPTQNFLETYQRKAGLNNEINARAIIAYGLRMGITFALVGLVFGFLISPMLAALGFLLGLVFGFTFPYISIRQEAKARNLSLEKELPDFAEIVCLGLRSGMSFDMSFSLYSRYYDTPFSYSCATALQSWSMGVTTRNNALIELSEAYQSQALKQLMKDTIGALHSGTNCIDLFSQAAALSREQYKAKCEEQNAKAPIKMMLPIGTLILPAMLLLVLGPVLLELINTL